MSTLDCNGIHRNGLAGIGLPSIDNTARLNTSRTCDCWTHSKNSDTSSEPLQATLHQEQPKHHANPTTTMQPLARRPSQPSQRQQHYLRHYRRPRPPFQQPEPAHLWAITTTIPAESHPVIARYMEGGLQPLYKSTGPSHGGDRLSPLANFLNGCAPHSNSVSGTLR